MPSPYVYRIVNEGPLPKNRFGKYDLFKVLSQKKIKVDSINIENEKLYEKNRSLKKINELRKVVFLLLEKSSAFHNLRPYNVPIKSEEIYYLFTGSHEQIAESYSKNSSTNTSIMPVVRSLMRITPEILSHIETATKKGNGKNLTIDTLKENAYANGYLSFLLRDPDREAKKMIGEFLNRLKQVVVLTPY